MTDFNLNLLGGECNMAGTVPKIILRSLALLKAINMATLEYTKIARGILYLWREFYVKTRIEVVPKDYIIEFKYKDNTIVSCRAEDLKSLSRLIEEVKNIQIKEDK